MKPFTNQDQLYIRIPALCSIKVPCVATALEPPPLNVQSWLQFGCCPVSFTSLDLQPLLISEEGSSSGDLWTQGSLMEE